MTKYETDVEQQMKSYFSQLGEKDRRHYAAVEASKLSYGGRRYISDLLGLSESVIRKGIRELNDITLRDQIPEGKHRRSGGGRKKKK